MPIENLLQDAAAVLNSEDPVARRLATSVLERFSPAHPGEQRCSDGPPPCPGFGRRFSTVYRTGRQPLHGPKDDRCPGVGDPI